MVPSLLKDPFVAEQIEDAVRPFIGRLPPEDIEWMRKQLALLLERDRDAFEALKGAHPRVNGSESIDISGERTQLGIDEDDSEAAAN